MPQTGLTYYINSKMNRISTMIDGKQSVIQAIYKALDTEKLGYEIYGWLYGLDMEPFIGQDLDYVQTHIQSYIEDCLLQDDRINAIQNLVVEQQDIDSCLITFDVDTTEGMVQGVTKEINYGE
jgi:hypothetical protein